MRRTLFARFAPHALVVCSALAAAAGCSKEGGQQGGGQGNAEGGQQGSPTARSAGIEPVLPLEMRYTLQLPRSSAGGAVELPWQGTATAAAPGKPGEAPDLNWTKPAVVLGRLELFAAGKSLGKMECVGPADRCKPEALTGATGEVVLQLPAAAIADGKVTALAATAAEWKDKEVLVFTDRRIAWRAVDAVLTTLRAAGAKPVLAASGYDGNPVSVLPRAGGDPNAATGGPSTVDDSGQDPIPAGLTRFEVEVRAGGVSLNFHTQPGNEPTHPAVMGNIAPTLANYAERAMAAAPAVSATVLVEPEVAVDEVLRVLDGLGDTCARAPKASPCKARKLLFANPAIALLEVDAAAADAAAPTPTTAPAAGAAPAAPAAAAPAAPAPAAPAPAPAP